MLHFYSTMLLKELQKLVINCLYQNIIVFLICEIISKLREPLNDL